MIDARLGIGGNKPPIVREIALAEDLPAEVTAYLNEDFARLPRQLDDLLERARLIPQAIEDDAVMGDVAKLIKELRDLTKEIEATHAAQKSPYFRTAQAIDNWFFGLWEKAARRQKTGKPGAADVLSARIDDYNQRKLRAEQERRRQEEERTRREAEQKRREEEEARRKAEEERLRAERTRNPDLAAEKAALAAFAERAAAAAEVEADLAAAKAQEARIAVLARPADMVRTRIEEGPTVTMTTEPYVLITDFEMLDINILRPFIPHNALEKAVCAWARATDYNIRMRGAEIGRRPKTMVR